MRQQKKKQQTKKKQQQQVPCMPDLGFHGIMTVHDPAHHLGLFETLQGSGKQK